MSKEKFIVLDSVKSQSEASARDQFALDILKGFSSDQKGISSKYFYDDKGSKIYEQIMDLDDYYPVRCETENLERNKARIVEICSQTAGKGKYINVIELGAGDGRKTRILLNEFLQRDVPFRYFPVDISEAAVSDLTDVMAKEMPAAETLGVVGEYFESLKAIESKFSRETTNLVIFLGSNIGNFDRAGAEVFCRTVWAQLNKDDLFLAGFDLKKSISLMTRAYSDNKGITAEFNLNVLDRINRELGGNFERSKFMHHGFYNPRIGAMESYLISLEDQKVYIAELEKEFEFRAFEPIHLEYSNKYLRKDIESLAQNTGFKVIENFTDTKGYFVDSLMRAEKDLRRN